MRPHCPTCLQPIIGVARRDLNAGDIIGTLTMIGFTFGPHVPGAICLDPRNVGPPPDEVNEPCSTCIRDRSAEA